MFVCVCVSCDHVYACVRVFELRARGYFGKLTKSICARYGDQDTVADDDDDDDGWKWKWHSNIISAHNKTVAAAGCTDYAQRYTL